METSDSRSYFYYLLVLPLVVDIEGNSNDLFNKRSVSGMKQREISLGRYE